MQEIELKLIAPNSEAIKSIRQVATESEKLYKNNEKNQKREKGLIEDIEDAMQELQESRKKAFTVTEIEKYNQKLAVAKKDLDEYNKAGIEGNKQVEKSSDGVLKKIGAMALAYVTVTTVVKVLKETVLAFFTKTEQGFDLLERKVSGFKAAIGVLRGEFIKLGKSITTEDDRGTPWGTRILTVFKGISEFYLHAPRLTDYFKGLEKSMNEASVAAENYTRLQQELADSERAMIVPRAKANSLIVAARLLYADESLSYKERIDALSEALRLEDEVAEKEIKHQQLVILNMRDRNNELEKTGQLRDEDRLELEKAIAREIELQTESDQRKIRATNSLYTIEKAANDALIKEQKDKNDKLLKDQEEYYLEQRDLLFNYLGDIEKANEDAIKKAKEASERQWDFETKIAKLLTNQQRDAAKAKWDAILEAEEKAKEEEENLQQARLDALKQGLNELLEFTHTITDRELEDAQRHREILDTRIDETQAALEAEIELYKAGYASNVDAKKKELADLKKQRDKALKDEEAALQKQRVMESIAQGVNIFSSATNILKSSTKMGPLGIILAAGAIAAMFTLLGSVKKRSSEIRLASGGHGEVKGRLHSEGGERFLDHVEIEAGERWGVLSRPASRKYGKAFYEMVDSFNKNKPSIPRSGIMINNINNDGPNKRLDEVNSNLRRISSKEEIMVVGSTTIYKKGSSIRVIKRR